MLRVVANKNGLGEQYQNIDVSNMFYYDDKIAIETKTVHNLNDGSEIYLERNNSIGDLLFKESVIVEVLNNKSFLVPLNIKEFINVSKCENIETYYPLKDESEIKLLKLTIETTNLFTKRNVNIKEFHSYYSNHNIICPNDYISYDGIFLLKCKDNGNGVTFYNELYNTTERLFFFRNDSIDYIDIFLGINTDGSDYWGALYWKYNEGDEHKVKYLLENFSNTTFYFNDTRFFKLENYVLGLRKKFDGSNDVKIYTVKNGLDINLNIKENFDATLLKNEYYKNFYVEDKINENINDIVDMEKQIFHPKLEKNDSNCVLNEIKFKINLRVRNEGWDSSVTENKWYEGTNGNTNITDIGFTEDDVKYQKSALKKTFLRLSFYDTPHRGNQKLLYYSTLFLDSNKIYKEYLYKNKISDLEFSVKNSFNQFTSSEGYYLYLFPKLAKKNEPTTIYMKVEFNHAKFGKTLSLVLPSDNQYKDGYINGMDSNGESMAKLFNDLYIKINILYDDKNNKYVWYIPDLPNNSNNDFGKVNDYVNQIINMTLFEPIVTKSE